MYVQFIKLFSNKHLNQRHFDVVLVCFHVNDTSYQKTTECKYELLFVKGTFGI